jgi:hypothetical protein
VANRAVVELHRLAREQANLHRGQPEWGKWARLANAVRSGILQLAAIRDSVKGLEFGAVSPDADAEETDGSDPDLQGPGVDRA